MKLEDIDVNTTTPENSRDFPEIHARLNDEAMGLLTAVERQYLVKTNSEPLGMLHRRLENALESCRSETSIAPAEQDHHSSVKHWMRWVCNKYVVHIEPDIHNFIERESRRLVVAQREARIPWSAAEMFARHWVDRYLAKNGFYVPKRCYTVEHESPEKRDARRIREAAFPIEKPGAGWIQDRLREAYGELDPDAVETDLTDDERKVCDLLESQMVVYSRGWLLRLKLEVPDSATALIADEIRTVATKLTLANQRSDVPAHVLEWEGTRLMWKFLERGVMRMTGLSIEEACKVPKPEAVEI